MASGSRPSIRWPMNSMPPSVTLPSSVLRSPEMAFRVVVLPAPLAPRRATICPSATSSDSPLRTRMTSL